MKTSKLGITGLCTGNHPSPIDSPRRDGKRWGWFPTKQARDAENFAYHDIIVLQVWLATEIQCAFYWKLRFKGSETNNYGNRT